MSKVHIRYTVRPDEVRENIALLHAFLDELRAAGPKNLVYEAYLMEDRKTFVHIVDSTTGPPPFSQLPSYRRFRDTLHVRCIEPPQMVTLKDIGLYK